jgi:hypothetical protein
LSQEFYFFGAEEQKLFNNKLFRVFFLLVLQSAKEAASKVQNPFQ